ncbi:MAG: hypothetical protein OXC48_05240, partial [Endozoicomonadaceae bacterium]|nr:hypothetical protein [Endozoicomonadaceae bacterium]
LADLVINIAAGAALAFFGTAAAESMEETAIEMEELPWSKDSCEMLKGFTVQTENASAGLPSGVVATEVSPALKTHLLQAGLTHYLGENRLILKNTDAVLYIWKWLCMSRFKNLIFCDTATILITARINGKSLALNSLSNLINLHNELDQPLSEFSELRKYCYKGMLEQILHSLSDNHTVISTKVRGNEINFYALSRMVPVGEHIVICGNDEVSRPYITVLRRLDDEWQYCNFNCGVMFAKRSNLSAIYREFFWSHTRNEPDISLILKLKDDFIEEVIPEADIIA